MTPDTVSRAEFEARLRTIETRENAHFDRLTAKIESLRVDQHSLIGDLDKRVSKLEVEQSKSRCELKADLNGVRFWIFLATLSLGVTMIVINHTMTSNSAATYGTGHDVGVATAELKRAINELRIRLPQAPNLPAPIVNNPTPDKATQRPAASR
ncbi:protein of unknown function [Pararobbsia alpina]|uniref:hypothetical protein n=1 Tax=Pararobbsia alpina TaxID=621374 RepID=UPI0039A66BF3